MRATDPNTKEPDSVTSLGGGWGLLPCAPDVCQECAKDHEPEMPHDAASLYYQYHFLAQHDRWPTWADAMAHCTEEMQHAWINELAKHGVDVE